LYCITDVRELHEWHVKKCGTHPCFECIVVVHPQDKNVSSARDVIERAQREDPCICAMMNETEEGKKVHRNGGDKFFAVYRRVGTSLSATATTTTTDTRTVMPGTSTTTITTNTSLDASNFFA
jgi:tRNA (guanine-N7-)-methyltransferase